MRIILGIATAIIIVVISVFTMLGINSIFEGTTKLTFKCVKYSPSGSCSERVLLYSKNKYELTLIKD